MRWNRNKPVMGRSDTTACAMDACCNRRDGCVNLERLVVGVGGIHIFLQFNVTRPHIKPGKELLDSAQTLGVGGCQLEGMLGRPVLVGVGASKDITSDSRSVG